MPQNLTSTQGTLDPCGEHVLVPLDPPMALYLLNLLEHDLTRSADHWPDEWHEEVSSFSAFLWDLLSEDLNLEESLLHVPDSRRVA